MTHRSGIFVIINTSSCQLDIVIVKISTSQFFELTFVHLTCVEQFPVRLDEVYIHTSIFNLEFLLKKTFQKQQFCAVPLRVEIK